LLVGNCPDVQAQQAASSAKQKLEGAAVGIKFKNNQIFFCCGCA